MTASIMGEGTWPGVSTFTRFLLSSFDPVMMIEPASLKHGAQTKHTDRYPRDTMG
jgi:hypothetical protein